MPNFYFKRSASAIFVFVSAVYDCW